MSDDLIKRSDAIEAIELVDWYHQNRYGNMVHGANSDEHQTWYKSQDIYKALENVPSADNEVIGKLKTAIENEKICKNCPTAERITGENLLGAMALGFSYGMEADRPQGKWIDKGWKGDWQFETDGRGNCWKVFECSVCNGENIRKTRFCPHCEAKMKKE